VGVHGILSDLGRAPERLALLSVQESQDGESAIDATVGRVYQLREIDARRNEYAQVLASLRLLWLVQVKVADQFAFVTTEARQIEVLAMLILVDSLPDELIVDVALNIRVAR